MKTQIKKTLVLSFVIMLLFSSCRTEEMEFIQSPNELQANSNLTTQLQRVAMNDGSKDNIIYNANCFNIQFPVTVIVNGVEITVTSEDDYDDIEDIFDEFDDDDDTIEINFPISIILSDYSESSNTKLPFDVQAGVTYKPEHMPLRFSATVYNLARGSVYDDPNDEDTSGTLDKVMSHLNFGAEVLLHRNVNVLVGYNFLRQSELKAESGGGGSGFTFGLAAKIKSVDIVLGSSRYSVGNSNYTFTVAANLDKMIFKKREL